MTRIVCAAALGGLLAIVAPSAQAAPPAPPPAAARSISLAEIRLLMIGTWQSADDPSFTRAFDDSGKATERYAGDDSATAAGTWRLFSGSNPPPEFAAQGLEARAVYLELRERGDVLLFALTHADQATLQMISLARGNVLNFSRLK